MGDTGSVEMDGQPLRGVGKTALGVALIRARESSRPDRLFDDPFAAAFAAAAPEMYPRARLGNGGGSDPRSALAAVLSAGVIVRTRFFDDYLLAACAAGCRQIVLLAAGLDTRAFRLPLPAEVRLFELDTPDVLGFKEKVLAGQSATARCERTVVAADLREHWQTALTDAGFDGSAPTAWLVEGLLIYLSASEAAGLLTAVGELSAGGGQLSFEHSRLTDEPWREQARATPEMDSVTTLWRGGLGEDAAGWLASRGWQPRTYSRQALAAEYGREVPAALSGRLLIANRPPVA